MTPSLFAATAAQPAGWLGVDWGALLLVLGVALVAAVVVTVSFAVGTRMLAVGAPDIEVAPGEEADGPNAVVRPRTRPRPLGATAGALLFYAIGAAATIYGVYLVVPVFHVS
jgi:hypothetical protein